MLFQRALTWWGVVYLNAAVIHFVQAFVFYTVVLPWGTEARRMNPAAAKQSKP